MTEFPWQGAKYRTNADASLVERLDGKVRNRTGSMRVRDAALCYIHTLESIAASNWHI